MAKQSFTPEFRWEAVRLARKPGLDESRRARAPLPGREPAPMLGEFLPQDHRVQPVAAPTAARYEPSDSARARDFSDSMLWTGRKSSTNGSIARIPAGLASKPS